MADDGEVFTASQDAQAITTAVDLFYLTTVAEAPFKLIWLDLGQTTDLGDAAEEVLRIGIYRGVTGGGAGAALTEASIGVATGGNVVAVGQGAASTAGTLLWVIHWNIRQAGPVWVPTPELQPRITSVSDPVVFRLLAAPTDSITFGGTVAWIEI